jgi:hypothetical protein
LRQAIISRPFPIEFRARCTPLGQTINFELGYFRMTREGCLITWLFGILVSVIGATSVIEL